MPTKLSLFKESLNESSQNETTETNSSLSRLRRKVDAARLSRFESANANKRTWVSINPFKTPANLIHSFQSRAGSRKRPFPEHSKRSPLLSLSHRGANYRDRSLRSTVGHSDRFSLLDRLQHFGESGLKLGDSHCFHVRESFWQTAPTCQLVHFDEWQKDEEREQKNTMQVRAYAAQPGAPDKETLRHCTAPRFSPYQSGASASVAITALRRLTDPAFAGSAAFAD
jgi:hypothetical protein